MQRSLISLFSIGFVQIGSGHPSFTCWHFAGPSIPWAPVGLGAIPALSPRWPHSGIPVVLPGLACEGCLTLSPAFLALVPSRWILSSRKALLRLAIGDEKGNGLCSRGNLSCETANLPFPQGALPKPAHLRSLLACFNHTSKH